jgi:signal transduction histidine kinase
MAGPAQEIFPRAPATEASDHIVQFYNSDDLLCDRVAAFLADGLDAGDACLIVATPTHTTSIVDRLRLRGVDITLLLAKGQLVTLDAEQTLEKLMTDAAPDAARFRAEVGAALDRLASAGTSFRLRVYGEMVDLLWKAGNHRGAIALEELWNDLLRERPFSLLCAYAMGNFYKQADGLQRVCETHAQVFPPETEATALSAELGQRKRIEQALRESVSELRRHDAQRAAYTRQAERLLRITAAIADAVTREQVCEAVVDQVGAALGASSAGLWVVREASRTANLARCYGYTPEAARSLESLSIDGDGTRSLPALDAIRTGRPVWIASQAELIRGYPHLSTMVSPERQYRVACLPVAVQGHTIGTLAFTFDTDGELEDEDERSLLLLVARYAGQALERLRLLEAEQASRTAAEEAASRMSLLYALARAVIGAGSVAEVFDAALDAISAALATDRASILVFDSQDVMRFKAWRGLSEGYRRAVEGHSPWKRDAKDPQPIVIDDVAADPQMSGFLPLFKSEGIGALAFIPLVADGRLLGKFMVYYQRPRVLGPRELNLARAIADQVAAAISRFAAVAELHETVRFNEMFTGILGHDLRNPLNAIVTSARLAMTREGSDKLVKPLSRILNSGDRMTRMIDQLLDFTRVRLGGGIPLGRQAVDLAPVIRQVMDELDDAHPAWTLRFEARGNTDGLWDADRLSQVFSNLIANALHHGVPEGGVTVAIDGTASGHVRIDVRNAGTIPKELLPTIFDPLSGSTRRDKARGLGLGLYITSEIVKSHRGQIIARSNEQDGTTFSVVLPREARAEIAT